VRLKDALPAPRSQTWAIVGSGGKTSALFRLARQLEGPVLVSTTTHLGDSQLSMADKVIMMRQPADLAELDGPLPQVTVLVGGRTAGEDRWFGPEPFLLQMVKDVSQDHGWPLLLEADGSRMLPLKAPAEHEPAIPGWVDGVMVVAGLTGLGQALNSGQVHRPEIYAALSGLEMESTISTEAAARVLRHPQGGLKNIPRKARRVLVLNQADSPELAAQAQTMSEVCLKEFERVAITCFKSDEEVKALRVRTAGVVMAAGGSTRMGQLKQVMQWRGAPLVRHAVTAALAAGLDPVIVVTGAEAEQVHAVLTDLPVQLVDNLQWREGKSSSLRCGVGALPPETGAAIFLQADQPQVTPWLLRALMERHSLTGAAAIAPLVEGQRTTPVLFDARTFSQLAMVQGEQGGQAIFSRIQLDYLPWLDGSLLVDLDTPEDFQKLDQLYLEDMP